MSGYRVTLSGAFCLPAQFNWIYGFHAAEDGNMNRLFPDPCNGN